MLILGKSSWLEQGKCKNPWHKFQQRAKLRFEKTWHPQSATEICFILVARNSQTRITSGRWMLPVWPTTHLGPVLIRTTSTQHPSRNKGNNHPGLLRGIFAVSSLFCRTSSPLRLPSQCTELQRQNIFILFSYRSVLFLSPLFIQHWFFHRLKTLRILHFQGQGSAPKVKTPEKFYGFLF